MDGGDSVSGSSDGEIMEEEVVMVPHEMAQPPKAVPPLVMDPGMWLKW